MQKKSKIQMQTMLQAGVENQGMQGCAIWKHLISKSTPWKWSKMHIKILFWKKLCIQTGKAPPGICWKSKQNILGHSETQIQIYFLSQKNWDAMLKTNKFSTCTMLTIRQMHVQTILIHSKLTNIFSTEKLARNAKKKTTIKFTWMLKSVWDST